ncbi:probable Endo-beta-1,6-galactanase [Cephalotrichum gorgonifer]|uniref:Probable Endo-beta-1,6-galactanase n=1 Tax=Cephalotrichum gorgonifer TaxID=2041049 RepID=A0AAE8MW56_9PEZI|nr:probable Endo-beta-1,6-galactanase [Cephalotrichum gorgonifer]
MVLLAPLSLAALTLPVVLADLTASINADSNWGTWEGWGTSLAWWAARFGDRDDLADAFFTLKSTTVNGETLPGLGFTIARYNAGASSWNTVNGDTKMVESSKIIRSRLVEGYWIDWASKDPSSSSWDWTVDAKQRAMLTKAIARGVTHTELFSNSPMWWMCKNKNPSGGPGGVENIQSWNLEDHAVYMATVAEQFRDRWNINFSTISPFNEPSADWWNDAGTQEGCHLNVPTQATIIGHLANHIASRGLSSKIAASDESYFDQAVSNLQNIGSSAISKISRINVHGYQGGSGRRDVLYNLAQEHQKPLWNSEFGNSGGNGADMAKMWLVDMRWMHPTAWVYWQVLDGAGWGLIDADNESGTMKGATQKYFVFAQLSRHIRPGMRILDSGDENVVAFYSAPEGKLVVVAVNWSTAQYINVDLGRFAGRPAEGSKVTRWSTKMADGGERYVKREDTTFQGTKFWSWFETNTIQTFEVTGVKI